MKKFKGIPLRLWAGRMVIAAGSVLVVVVAAHALLSGHAANAPLIGVDVSHYNPGLNVTQAKAEGISYTFIKATQGISYSNPDFASDRMNAENGGLMVGAYHFLNPSSSSSPASQCTYYLNRLNATGGTNGIMLAIDVELQTSTAGASYQDVKDFLAACQPKTPGRTWIIYTGGWYWGNSKQAGYLHNPAAPAGTVLWISIYVGGTGSALDLLTKVGAQGTSGDPYATSQINGWPDYAIRQYSSTATVANLSPLDVDVTYKGMAFLRDLAGLSAPPPCTAVPSAPGSFGATGTTTPSASLTWTASTPGANCTLSGYKIWRAAGSTVPATTGTPLATLSPVLNYSDATVTASSTYTYVVAAYDTTGHLSPGVSKTVTIPAPPVCAANPSAPGAFAAVAVAAPAVNLTWTASVPGANCTLSGYKIWRAVGTTPPPTTGTPLKTLSGLLNYSDAAVVAGTTYTYLIVSYDSAGHNSTSATKTIAVPIVPPPPLPGDANNDGRVNAIDLSLLISHDGQNYPAADFNKDGTVGAADLAILLGKWTW